MDVSENEIGLREARAQLGELVSKAQYSGVTTYITRHGRRVAAITPIPEETPVTTVIWSVVRGESPTARAVEPGLYDITVPLDIIDWAESHQFSDDNPDTYLLVTPKDEAGEVPGEVAFMEGTVPADELARLREALAELDN